MKVYIVIVGLMNDKIDNVFGTADGAEAYVEAAAREQLGKTSLTVPADQKSYLAMVRGRYTIKEFEVVSKNNREAGWCNACGDEHAAGFSCSAY